MLPSLSHESYERVELCRLQNGSIEDKSTQIKCSSFQQGIWRGRWNSGDPAASSPNCGMGGVGGGWSCLASGIH